MPRRIERAAPGRQRRDSNPGPGDRPERLRQVVAALEQMRYSLFLLAQLRVDGRDELHRVKVRNLSAGGMMAEGDVKVLRGALVEVELRNLGWIEGTVRQFFPDVERVVDVQT